MLLHSHVRLDTPVIGTRKVDGLLVVVHMERGEFFVLRDCAALIFELLLQGKDFPAILHALSGTYAAELETLRQDLYGFIEQLLQRGLAAPVN